MSVISVIMTQKSLYLLCFVQAAVNSFIQHQSHGAINLWGPSCTTHMSKLITIYPRSLLERLSCCHDDNTYVASDVMHEITPELGRAERCVHVHVFSKSSLIQWQRILCVLESHDLLFFMHIRLNKNMTIYIQAMSVNTYKYTFSLWLECVSYWTVDSCIRYVGCFHDCISCFATFDWIKTQTLAKKQQQDETSQPRNLSTLFWKTSWSSREEAFKTEERRKGLN